MEHNNTAKIYLRKSAFDKHYVKVCGIPFLVGLDESLKDKNQIIYTDDIFVIDDELTLFSNVQGRKYFSMANKKLCSKYNGKMKEDQFEHEQNLIVRENDRDVLFSGCSHNGIVNIMDKYYEINKNHRIDTVIGGFHLFNPVSKKYESDELITEIAKELSKQECRFYTCHCTGPKAYQVLKNTMNDKLEYLSTGTVLDNKKIFHLVY